jgi:hypothetical protein
VVDGSNIATEGRSLPSLAQLEESVEAFVGQHEFDILTVVVDATFGHRIAVKERKWFDELVSTGQLVTPPAGAIGRGDAFILQIADRTGAVILSNDSFQEFHGTHLWLFDEGRLYGGKPIAHVGWVFVARAPVRGPTSRRVTRKVKEPLGDETLDAAPRSSSRPATAVLDPTMPMPVPTAPPPRSTSGVGYHDGRSGE